MILRMRLYRKTRFSILLPLHFLPTLAGLSTYFLFLFPSSFLFLIYSRSTQCPHLKETPTPVMLQLGYKSCRPVAIPVRPRPVPLLSSFHPTIYSASAPLPLATAIPNPGLAEMFRDHSLSRGRISPKAGTGRLKAEWRSANVEDEMQEARKDKNGRGQWTPWTGYLDDEIWLISGNPKPLLPDWHFVSSRRIFHSYTFF